MIKIHLNEKQRNRINNGLAVLVVIIFLFPIYWVVVSSLKMDQEIFKKPPTLIPHLPTLSAYIQQFTGANSVFRPFLNSVIVAVGSMLICLTLSVPAAYGLARYKVKGSKFFMLVFLVTQMLPASLVLTPLYLIYSRLGLLNNYLAPILSTATVSVPFVILMLRPIFLNCPIELEEAARIDGCNRFSAFIRIIIPISKPGIVTAFSFGFIMAWNDLAYSMTFNTKEAMRPMTAGIYQFLTLYGTRWNMIMAYGVLLILPIVILFMSLQKHIVSGLVSGAVKG
ncbi:MULTISPECIES: carbohydrate ABC transporter permease [Robinsoniella]|uniref:carbohydrate ABC transporter permease n=1 Tax=Robinsoniella TaxID=588605 RepID=UPI00047F8F12|nr:carbohydrate ABC transporter permease [Robinsoniella sp. KNHs210]